MSLSALAAAPSRQAASARHGPPPKDVNGGDKPAIAPMSAAASPAATSSAAVLGALIALKKGG